MLSSPSPPLSHRRLRLLTAFAVGTVALAAAPVGAGPVRPVESTVPPGMTTLAETQALAGRRVTGQPVSFTVGDGVPGGMLFSGSNGSNAVGERSNRRLTFHDRLLGDRRWLVHGTGIFPLAAFGYGEGVTVDADPVASGTGLNRPGLMSRDGSWVDFQFDGDDAARPAEASEASQAVFVRSETVELETGGFAIAGAPAGAIGVDAGTDAGAVFTAMTGGADRPAAIPLPAAVSTGVVGLGLAAVAKRRMRRSRR